MRLLLASALVASLVPAHVAAQSLDCGKLVSCDHGPPVLAGRPISPGGGRLLDGLEGACEGADPDACSETFAARVASAPEHAALETSLPGFADAFCSDEHATLVSALGTTGTFEGIGPVVAAAGDPAAARCVVARFVEGAPSDWFPSFILPEVGDEVVLLFAALDVATELATLPDDPVTLLFAATIVHGAWELPEFLSVAERDPVRASVALAMAARAMRSAFLVTDESGIDFGDRLVVSDDVLLNLAVSDRLAASALMARSALAVPDTTAESGPVPGYRVVEAGAVSRMEVFWGDATGHLDFRPMPNRRTGLDHIGAYNFMVEIEGVAAFRVEIDGVDAGQFMAGDRVAGDDVVVLYRKRPGRAKVLDSEFYVDADVIRVGDDDVLSVRGTGWSFPPTLLDRGEAGDNILDEGEAGDNVAYYRSVSGVGAELPTRWLSDLAAADAKLAQAIASPEYVSGQASVALVVPVGQVLDVLPAGAGWSFVGAFPALSLVVSGG